MKEISEKLEEGIRSVLDSREFRRYLSFMGTFHEYSANNVALILKQFPKASMVAGYYTWNNTFKRHIKKGEKGIKVIMPCPVRVRRDDKEGGERYVTVPRFRVGYVYDVSQTEGRELPRLEIRNLSGDVKDYDMLLRAVREAAGLPVRFEHMENGANGYYSNLEKAIVISDVLSQAHSIKTLIHELAHHILHDRDILMESGTVKENWEKETEAESIAYCVCSHLGIDASEYSFRYIAAWAEKRDMKEIRKGFETIRKTSLGLIYAIDGKYAELIREKEVDELRDSVLELTGRGDHAAWMKDPEKLRMMISGGDTDEISSFLMSEISSAGTKEKREEISEILERLSAFHGNRDRTSGKEMER